MWTAVKGGLNAAGMLVSGFVLFCAVAIGGMVILGAVAWVYGAVAELVR